MSLLIQNKSWGDSILDTLYILCPPKQRFRGIYCPRFDIQIHLSFPPPLGHLNSYAAHALNMHRKLLSFNPSNIFHTLDSWAPCSLWRLTLWLPRKFTRLTQNFTKFQGKCQNVSNNKKRTPKQMCCRGQSELVINNLEIFSLYEVLKKSLLFSRFFDHSEENIKSVIWKLTKKSLSQLQKIRI